MLVVYNVGVPGHFDTENYTQRLDIVQKSLWILSMFLSDFLGPNVVVHPRQNVSNLLVNNVYKYLNSLAQKIIH